MVKILIAGDFCPLNGVQNLIQDKKYDSIFEDIKSLVLSVDYSIVNFETCVAQDSVMPIFKLGPNLKCNVNAIEAIKYAGFDCVTLANNHIRDYGNQGVENTLRSLIYFKFNYVGAGKNRQEAKTILYKTIKNIKIAIINFCENEFSIATTNQYGAAPLDVVENYYQISEAKKNADHVIVIVHGGHEHFQLPSPRMKKTYRFFVDVGADVVINHHQHCFSGYEVYNEKPIFYGLGNFCFDENIRDNIWNYGYMVNLLFSDKIEFELIPYEQCNGNLKISPLKDKKNFDGIINELNVVIQSDSLLGKKVNEYLYNQGKILISNFEPYSNRYLKGLYRRHLLPSFMNTIKKKIVFRNLIECESHRDKILNYLKDSQVYDVVK